MSTNQKYLKRLFIFREINPDQVKIDSNGRRRAKKKKGGDYAGATRPSNGLGENEKVQISSVCVDHVERVTQKVETRLSPEWSRGVWTNGPLGH